MENILVDARQDEQKRKAADSAVPAWQAILSLTALAALLLDVYAVSVRSLAVLVLELLLGVAALTLGSLTGFLFGIPRAATADEPAKRVDAAVKQELGQAGYKPSTNLEQVSDWLTKIIVGVGLVQIGKIGDALATVGTTVSRAFPFSGIGIVSQLVVVAFAVLGFLGGFLWTRISYAALQTSADAEIRRMERERDAQIRSLAVDVEQNAKRFDAAIAETAQKADQIEEFTRGWVSKSVAAGPTSVAVPATREASVDALMEHWPPELREKVERFRNSDPYDYDSDPGAGLFADAPQEKNSIRLEAEIASSLKKILAVRIIVRSVDGAALPSPVVLLLHPTFQESVEVLAAKNGRAEDTVYSEGVFTAVAIINDGQTVLAYSLKDLPNAPEWFKNN
jgi:hypothetical protein